MYEGVFCALTRFHHLSLCYCVHIFEEEDGLLCVPVGTFITLV